MKRYQIIPTEEALCGGVAVFSDVLGGNSIVRSPDGFLRMCEGLFDNFSFSQEELKKKLEIELTSEEEKRVKETLKFLPNGYIIRG